MKKYIIPALLLVLLALSCVSLDKNIAAANKKLNQAQNVDAGVYAIRQYNNAAVLLLQARHLKDEDKKAANNKALASRQAAEEAYLKSLHSRLLWTKEKNKNLDKKAVSNHASNIAPEIYNQARSKAEEAAQLRARIAELTYALQKADTNSIKGE